MKVLLHNKELWEKFKEHQTEMIVTKEGRRMCPMVSLTFEDLNPNKVYAVMVDFMFADNYKYCFDTSLNCWVPWGVIHEEAFSRMYLHPKTPTTGAILMKNGLGFGKLKLTNSEKTAWSSNQVILLYTMRRYFPRIHVIESQDGTSFDYKLRTEFCFPETDFIAVSAYRNKQITRLKINTNPFATAFRKNGVHGQAKRRRMEFRNGLNNWNDDLNDDTNLEESSNNGDDPVNGPGPAGPVQNYDKRELDGIRAAIPFLKDRLRRDVSFFVYNPIYNGMPSQEKVSNTTQVMENQPTEQMPYSSEGEAELTCEESTEWMWGFDEQMSLRYSPERPELEAFLPQKIDNLTGADEVNNEPKQGSCNGDAKKKGDGVNVFVQSTVSRRKKYHPRKLQRTDDVTPADGGSSANEERIQSNVDVPPVTEAAEANVLQAQLHDSDCNEHDKEEQLQSKVGTSPDCPEVTLPLLEADKTPCSQDGQSVPQPSQNQNLHLLSSGATAGVSVSSQDGPYLLLGESDESCENVPSDAPASKSEKTVESSLTALIQMCSEAGESASDESSLPGPKQDQRCISTGVSTFYQVYLPQESISSSSPSFCTTVAIGIQSTRPSSYSSGVNLATIASEVEERIMPSYTSLSSPSSELSTSVTTMSSSLLLPPKSTAAFIDNNTLLIRSEGLETVSTINGLSQATTAIENIGVQSQSLSITDRVCSPEISRAPASGSKHPEYRPIAPAPHPSNLSPDVPSAHVLEDSGYYYDNGSYPIIIDSFSLNDNIQYSFAKQPQVNLSYYPTPQLYQTGQASHNVVNSINSTVVKRSLPLEKFYSFPAPNSGDKHQVVRSRFQGGRHYKTTRTNFSRLSLEPLCSVIYPLTSCSRPVTHQRYIQPVAEDASSFSRTRELGAG